jgi:peptidyl-prolyl cis-trans isomerase SurA
MWPERVDAIMVTAVNEDHAKKAKKALETNMSIEAIKAELNSNNEQHIIVTAGIMSKDDQNFPENFKFKKGISEIYTYNQAFHVVKVNEVHLESVKSFKEAQGPVIADYQIVFEENWLKELAQKYKVSVNQKVLQEVKNKITN